MSKTEVVSAYECRVIGSAGGRVYNTLTPSKARYQYLLDVRDCYPDVSFADIAVRKVGGPVSSRDFIRNAAYRGMPDVRCGQRVRVKAGTREAEGVIVGHNGSANFEILFDEGSLFGRGPLNVHPGDVELIEG